jgi:predicted DNA binding protein
MTLIADITVPAEAFQLGRALQGLADVEIELERVVPLRERVVPLFWAAGDADAVEAALTDSACTAAVNRLVATGDRTLFEVRWGEAGEGVVDALVEADASVLEARGDADSWAFRLRFDSHEQLSAFNMAATESGVPVTLRHLYNPTPPAEPAALSAPQREALVLAYRRGFFEVPRRVTLAELADGIGISDSALSQRLRRALSVVVERAVGDEALVGTPP